jgi:hypothetical protein
MHSNNGLLVDNIAYDNGDLDVRIFVQKIFQSILLPGFSYQQNTVMNLPKSDEPIHEQVYCFHFLYSNHIHKYK